MQVQTQCTMPWIQHSHILWKKSKSCHLNCVCVKRMILTVLTLTKHVMY